MCLVMRALFPVSTPSVVFEVPLFCSELFRSDLIEPVLVYFQGAVMSVGADELLGSVSGGLLEAIRRTAVQS